MAVRKTIQNTGKYVIDGIAIGDVIYNPKDLKTSSYVKSYLSTRDFPYESMKVVSDEVYEVLKDAYGKMDFSVEFKGGNIEDNSEYIYAGLKRTEQEMKKS